MTPKCPNCKRDQDDCVCVDEIEYLRAQVAELKAENARLRMALADTEALEIGTAERCKRWREIAFLAWLMWSSKGQKESFMSFAWIAMLALGALHIIYLAIT